MTSSVVTKECVYTMSNQMEDATSQKEKKNSVNISLPCLSHQVSLKY